MSDDIPNYPPGPREPEEDTPGPLVSLSPDQLEYAHAFASSKQGVSTVKIQERGACYLQVELRDPDGEMIADELIPPIIGQFKFKPGE